MAMSMAPLPKTEMGWEIFPEGLTNVLKRVHSYAGGIPQYVTENGMAAPDAFENGAVQDDDRIAYIDAHFAAALAAIEAGVPLKGYLHLVAHGQFRMGPGLRQALRHRPGGFRQP